MESKYVQVDLLNNRLEENLKLSESLELDKISIRSSLQGEDRDAEMCPICFESWTTDGEHRLCALKCGHLFGYKCIMKWLTMESIQCPTCKIDVDINDVRYIFARKLTAANTFELCKVQQELANEKQAGNKLKLELEDAISKGNLLQQRLDDCENYLEAYKIAMMTRNQKIANLSKEWVVSFNKNIKCNALDAKNNSLIVIAMKSSLNSFSSFGVQKYVLEIDSLLPFTSLHSALVKDVKLHRENPWYLTCSLDKKAKVVNFNTNDVMITCDNDLPLWSCCWDPEHNDIFYVGQQSGSILKYDVRHPLNFLNRYFVPDDFSPVLSVQVIAKSSTFQLGGVLMCKLNSVWVFYNNANNEIKSYQLPIEGPFISMTYNNKTNHLFLSLKPDLRYRYFRHTLYKLTKDENNYVKCTVVHSFRSSVTQKTRTRACLFPNGTYAAAYVESRQNICMWSLDLGNTAATVTTSMPVVDLTYFETASADYLLCLGERKLKSYKIAT